MVKKKERSLLKGYAPLLKDKQVERWFDNLARGSPITAEVYLRRLGAFCKWYSVTPNSLLRMGQKGIKNMLLDLVNDLSKEKKAGSYIQSNMKAVKSWLSFNDIEVKTKIRIERSSRYADPEDRECLPRPQPPVIRQNRARHKMGFRAAGEF